MGPANVLLSDEARARENSFQSQHDFLLKEETERSAKNEKMSTNTSGRSAHNSTTDTGTVPSRRTGSDLVSLHATPCPWVLCPAQSPNSPRAVTWGLFMSLSACGFFALQSSYGR